MRSFAQHAEIICFEFKALLLMAQCDDGWVKAGTQQCSSWVSCSECHLHWTPDSIVSLIIMFELQRRKAGMLQPGLLVPKTWRVMGHLFTIKKSNLLFHYSVWFPSHKNNRVECLAAKVLRNCSFIYDIINTGTVTIRTIRIHFLFIPFQSVLK